MKVVSSTKTLVRTSFHHLTPCLSPSLTPCLTLRRRAAGSLSAALGLALLACGAGCETKPSATPATQAAGPASGTPTAAPTGAVPPPPAAPRRERAGIEVEGTPRPTLAPALAPTHREPAAELVAVPAASVAPPATTGPDADKAASALAFVRGPWLTAVQGLDGPAFAALLTDGFQVSLPPADDGTPRTVGRAEWAAARTPPLGSAATVLIGSPDVRIEEEPDPRTVVSFEERVETASGCQLLDRTLALHEGDGGWRVGTDDASNARECPANTPADVVKALRALASAAATDDPDKIHLHTTSGLRLRDGRGPERGAGPLAARAAGRRPGERVVDPAGRRRGHRPPERDHGARPAADGRRVASGRGRPCRRRGGPLSALMGPEEQAVAEALGRWTAAEIAALRAERYTPALMQRFGQAVRFALAESPDAARRAGLVPVARRVLKGPPELREALAADPALGRWTAAVEECAAGGPARERLDGLLALAPRFAVAAALATGGDLDVPVVLGSGGRARVPCDGRVLQGPAGRSVRVEVRGGELVTHARDARRVGPFEVVDGDAEAGRLPVVHPLSGGAAAEGARVLGTGVEALSLGSAELAAEAAALAPVLVPVGGARDVSHSASLAGARGCVWLTPVPFPLVIAETLVHETSHLKFFYVEDRCALTDPDDPPRFEVPWRPDPRPIRAVLMGLHAWARVLEWLRTLVDGRWGPPARQRIAVLSEATDAAAAIARRADGLTPAGRAVTDALIELAAGTSPGA